MMVRADNVGSLLRPRYLLEARDASLPPDELRAVEDRAVVEAIRLQEQVGLPVLTDGEYRRRFFFSTIEEIMDGVDPTGFVRHHRDFEGVEHELRTPTPVARLSRRSTLAEYEIAFTRSHTDRQLKLTMPAPSVLAGYWTEGVSNAGYASKDEYYEHLIELMNEDAKA